MFLPITKKEVEKLGWDYLDIILVSGDAYIDHPCFGIAVIGRTLENAGYRVAIIAQPNWKDDLRDFKKFGTPRLFFGVTSGAMDSMVNHYTAMKRLRSDDAYTPNNVAGFRPDYATSLYSNILKQLYPNVPIVLGGIEASMRRVAHYDYWADKLFPSILISSKADILVYGMGEKIILSIAEAFSKKKSLKEISSLPQIAFLTNKIEEEKENIILPSFEECLKNKKQQALSIRLVEENANSFNSKTIYQKYEEGYIRINPFDYSFSSEDLDKTFSLPYQRKPHPKYEKRGKIPAFEMIKHSVNIHRGCFGGCSFCTIAAHQGKKVVSRSEKSILEEVETISKDKDFKGYLSDIGGPSANMYKMQGKNLDICQRCNRPSCIHPSICKNLNHDHSPILSLYRKIRSLPYIKKAFIGSGIRYDIFTDMEYFNEVFLYHTSGRLKVAPEHTSKKVLSLMRKPSFDKFIEIKKNFDLLNKKYVKKQQLIPYFISSFPSCKEEDMKELSQITKKMGYKLEQVQDFTPTPMTIATEIYYTGYDPYTMEKIYCAKTIEEKKKQNLAFFWWKK
ncbi:MAG: YgiQ family radical SAM protein [Bacteroidales bacterium]|jgi:uncharacterized radical SAM protein YgiQ|nr:YgiQ family radical SAM protein [Bacteroidales bacterium]